MIYDRKCNRIWLGMMLCLLLLLTGCMEKQDSNYRQAAALLEETVLAEAEVGDAPVGAAGHAVFLSVCDGTDRARVFTGTGADLQAAWDDADRKTQAWLKKSGMDPIWVKADVAYTSQTMTLVQLEKTIYAARHEFFRYGLALDPAFETALLEAELNGAKIYAYDQGGIDLSYLNTYLRKADRPTVETLPDRVTLFQCQGWFCGEDLRVDRLYSEGLDYGRRELPPIDDAYAEELILSSTDFLLSQLKADGSFVYGMYPRFDNDIENYNMVRHAATIWSLVCRYRLTGETEVQAAIQSAIDHLLEHVVYADPRTAYLLDTTDDEIKLGGSGLAVVSMTAYMEAAGTDQYRDVCIALGNGILSMQDPADGSWYHVLNRDFSPKEAFRTVYYDGEATFALCQLYELTQDPQWLLAAALSTDYFIQNDYWQYKDHWIAYSMNAITKYIRYPEYFEFALRNAQENLETIYERDTTYHTYLELLMATFEVYDRMQSLDLPPDTYDWFDTAFFLKTIRTRAQRQLNGYFYPEYAMYMKNPQRILHTFMVRHDGYRVRIDDVQHNVGGYDLFRKNYEKLLAYGMPEV